MGWGRQIRRCEPWVRGLDVEVFEDEGVGGALAADRGLRAVTRKDSHVVGERHHLGPHRRHERSEVAARQVGASDRSGEQLITGEDGRITVEIFTAIYRSTRDGKPVKWPLKPESGNDYDGRVSFI